MSMGLAEALLTAIVFVLILMAPIGLVLLVWINPPLFRREKPHD